MGRHPTVSGLVHIVTGTFRVFLWLAILCAGITASTGLAQAQTKSLKLYYIHTGEKAEIIYKKNGKYLASGLKKVNWHLRDWRRNEPTKMNPKLLDLVWEAYRQSGSKGYITVISGYRSPASNNMLRKRGRGVAKNSQHTLGNALDFYLPDVKLKKLRDIGLKLQVGGVGYYPTSGSPFVHLDVGNVRHWPRMSRKELVSVFPDGKTMHIPSDGKPLAKYEQAVASYKARSASGKLVPEGKTKQLSFFQRLAQATKDDEADDESNDSAPAPRAVKATTTVAAPAPEPEPVPTKEEPQFASLPNNIPVPTLAPRSQLLETGSQIAVVTPEPENQAFEEAEITEETPANEEQTVLASLNVPIPLRNPLNEPVQASQAVLAAVETEETDTPKEATSELALTAPVPQVNVGTQVAVFSPQEIEDLRAAARPTTSATSLVAETSTDSAIVVASLDQNKTAEITPVIPVPTQKPVEPAIAENKPEAAIEPAEAPVLEALGIEPETRTTGKFAIPEKNPLAAAETLVAAAQEEKTEETALVLASLPVPVRNPKTTEAPIDPAAIVATAEPVEKPEPVLAARTISLDNLSAPQENTSSIGQWALSSETTIADLADVQAPAYGRNVIRQVPEVILVQSFTPQLFGPGKNNFKGKAVTAMRFAKLQIQ